MRHVHFTVEGSHLLHSGQGSAASSGVWETWGWPGFGRPPTPGHRSTSWPFRCRVNGTQRRSFCSLKVQISVHKIHWGESCITQLFFFFLVSLTGFKEVRRASSSLISNLDFYDDMMIWRYMRPGQQNSISSFTQWRKVGAEIERRKQAPFIWRKTLKQ